MHLEWEHTQTADSQQSSSFSNMLLQRTNVTATVSNKPPKPKQGNKRSQSKSFRENARSRSHRRRYYSISSNRASRGEKKIIVKQQPGGWYQVDQVTRNLSLAPREPSHEPLMAYSFAGDQETNRRKAKRRRKNLAKWQSQNRFPSPSVFRTTLGVLRELPCARLHYNTFKRMFPNLPTRTMKERRFRIEAAQEMPFAKYPNEQIEKSYGSDRYNEHPSAPNFVKNKTGYDYAVEPQKDERGRREGDTQVTEDISEQEDTNDDNVSEEEEEEDNIGSEKSGDIIQACDVIKITGKPKELERGINDHTSSVFSLNTQRPSSVVSEDLLSPGVYENGMPSTITQVDVNNVLEGNSGSATDTVQELSQTALSTFSPGSNYCEKPKDDTTSDTLLTSSFPLHDFDTGTEVPDSLPKAQSEPKAYQTLFRGSDKIKPSQKHLPPSLFRTSRPKPNTMGGVECSACGLAAYPAERLEADGQVFHVKCFRCHQCATMLHRGAWNQRGVHHFCNPCHRRIALQTLRH